MLPKIVWSMPKMGTFNLHASLLPQYRGAAPINWAIINGEEETGVTTFMIDDKIDTGAILMQRKCEIEPHETIGTLYDKLMDIGANLVIETVNGLINNSIKPKLQQEFISQEINIKDAPKITKEICRINWNNNALNIERQIRGLSPYPCAITTLNIESKSIDAKIFDAIVDNRGSNNCSCNSMAPEGTIITDNKSYLIVACGDNSFLRINEIQIAGKKRMHIKDFLAGFRNAESYTFR
jgi:Methionyl-tRNA formyltransferase